jgi:hypothetical protein
MSQSFKIRLDQNDSNVLKFLETMLCVFFYSCQKSMKMLSYVRLDINGLEISLLLMHYSIFLIWDTL